MSERLRRTSKQVEDRSFLSLSARLAKTLLDLADEDGLPVPEGIKVPFRMSQRNLAVLVGASRESVNKQFSAWQAEGLIALGRGELTLIRREALKQIVEDPE